MGTSRSVERLVDLLRNSEQLAAQRHHRSTDTLGDYDETQVRGVIKRVQAENCPLTK